MLTVDHKVGQSSIHGIGVFTNVSIKKGDIVWKFNSLIDKEVSIDDIILLPEHVMRIFARHAYYEETKRTFILGGDGDYFMNHSSEPNLHDDGVFMYAAKDISVGEELTCNYGSVRVIDFDPDKGQAHAESILDFYIGLLSKNGSVAQIS